ncbi:anthranilate synthase component I [Candidatus Laterigemmans baculatus]|uniref:anthranilate synthase component I n=1 Tax=Candidatus Laterigemmans baculatus TaxID=2770505 RepID=UPI0013DAE704|nr:anthranilate synthase component I [Candidatus Laterigemmans baculatus]
MHLPDPDTFAQAAAEHDYVPVYRRLFSDSLTPVSAFTLLDDGGPACLFESVVGGEKVGRFSILAVDPVLRYAARGDQVSITRGSETETTTQANPLEHFRSLLAHRVAHFEGLPPFIGGAVGYAGYDVVRYAEHLPDAPRDDRQLPDLDFSLYHTVVVFDNVTKTMTVVALSRVADFASAAEARRDACRRVDQIVERLSQPIPGLQTADLEAAPQTPLEVTSNFTRETFTAAVRKCIEYIRAGDIFQVVPSQRFSVRSPVAPLEVYRSLRVVNPSPFMFFLRTPECELIGCSPEIMCRVVDSVVTVRPLAGTRPRGATEERDQALERELLSDPKERAEHVMLVDLGRNDVGRVARFGTVELTEVMVIERYSHVMHISSEVRGKLREGLDAFDALKACLPAGTVSGAPKVRAMQVIDEVEPHRRGPYGGAVGYIDYRGNMDTCIALRTIVVHDQTYDVQAGCGVVADSNPDAEYDETVNKARGMMAAIELTHARLGL